ncbi:MAG: helix-turn-helix domain-containing protein [Rhodospirillales bacterium]|nr:helix-turn-helix domain-containing protein [Rhodospirillales bacterium]
MKEPLRVPLEAAEPDLVGPRLVHEAGGDNRPALPSFCAELREARQRGGYSVADAAHVLRIQEHYLEALEEGRFDQIPGTTYTIGFLRSYAGFLGLDPDEMVDAFKREQGLQKNEQRLAFPSPSDTSPKPKFWLILLVLVLAGLAYGGWQYQSTGGQIATDLVDDVSTRLTEAVGLTETEVAAGGATGEDAATEPAAAALTAEATAETAVAATEEPAAETATASIVAEATTAVTPEPASGTSDQAEPVPGPAAPREEASAPAAPAPEAPAATDGAQDSLIPAAEVWDEAGPEQAAEVAALEGAESEAAAVQPPPAADQASAETVQAAGAAASSEPAAAVAETSDPGPEIASPLDFGTTAVGGTSGAGAAAGSTDETVASDVSQTAEATDRVEVASLDTSGTDVAVADAAGDTAAPVTASAEPMIDASTQDVASTVSVSPATEEPSLPAVEPAYVPKVYGRTNLDSRVVITAVDDSWVQILGPDNELLLTRILHAGDSYRVPDRAGLLMVTGNAGGLEVRVDDAVAPALGPLGVVLRNIALDPDRLLAGTATGG